MIVRLCVAIALLALISNCAVTQIIYETGTLRGFLGGSCPGCAYDNWISHMSEGIALPGYNNYGPTELDPQTNGFGRYQLIPATPTGDSLVAFWYDIFSSFLTYDTSAVITQMMESALGAYYQLVVLSEPPRQYYILREVLNLDYYDNQLTPEDSTDDVWGSFGLGWGVYVLSPSAAKPWMIVEMPHPCDDFISPFIGVDAFELFDAGLLLIAGAGREVLWTNEGEYNNSKSLSDPSRNYRTVFNTAHRAFVDLHDNDFALQLHSYDSELHAGQRSLVISAGADDDFPNEPILDRCVYDDMISLTPYIAVPANTCGTHPDITIENYYQLYYEGGYSYQGQSPVIPTTNDLYGFGQNQQVNYSNTGSRKYQDPESIIHIEMDEFPDAIQDTITIFYNTSLPGQVTFANFENATQYYRPACQALEDALSETPMAELVSMTPSLLMFPNLLVYGTNTLSIQFFNDSPTQSLNIVDVYAEDQIFTVRSAPVGSVLYPGRRCAVSVVFNPQNALSYHRILTFSTDVGCSHVELVGTGLGAVPQFSPPFVDFGPISFNESSSTTVYLKNIGNYPTTFLGVISAPPHFRFESVSIPDTALMPSQQIPLTVIFEPQQIGIYQSTIYAIVDAYANDTLALGVTGQGAIVANLFFDSFARDKGWTGYGSAGEWTRGQPLGGPGDDTYGGPDPTQDHSSGTDNIAIGTDLTASDGDYEPGLAETYWLTSPVINCSSYVSVQLKYWRWLGVERNAYDHAYIQAFDGSQWVTVWQNPDETIDENFWSQHSLDVSSQADSNSQFQIRFGIGPTDGSWQYCGWNIDDVTVIGCEPVLATINNLTLTRYSHSSITLSWSPILYASYYRIYRSGSPEVEIVPENLIAEVSCTIHSYIDVGILDNMPKAFYRVTSGN